MMRLLVLLRQTYNAQYYVKIDTDVNISKREAFESTLLNRMPHYYGRCIVGYPLFFYPNKTLVPYANGGIYALSNATMGAIMGSITIKQVLSRWEAHFRTMSGKVRPRAEDAVVGATIFMNGLNLTCANFLELPILPHGCKTCDYSRS